MKKIIAAAIGLILTAAAIWFFAGWVSERNYALRPLETEEFSAPTFTVQIPKGWERPDYSDPRESRIRFTTSPTSRDKEDPYFVYGHLTIADEGLESVEAVVDEWRKGGDYEGPISKVKLGSIDAVGWTGVQGFVEVSGDDRTFVFAGTNGRTYSAHYLMARPGRYRKRQEFVFQRIIASMKFKPAVDAVPSRRR